MNKDTDVEDSTTIVPLENSLGFLKSCFFFKKKKYFDFVGNNTFHDNKLVCG